MAPTARLRELLARPGLVVAPGAFNPISATMVEAAGFDCVYVTGGGTAMSMGLPPLGLHTMTEMVNAARAITSAVSIPVICDSDTGYGSPLNVRRTIREFERAGVAGVHIEDQVFPSKSGHMSGKQLISTNEMVQKVRAACDAREDEDFLVIARCDALVVEGLEATVERSQRYVEAGADMVFVESPRTADEISEIARLIQAPLLFNMASTGKTPFLSTSDVERLGYKLMIFPVFTFLAALKGIARILDAIRTAGTVAAVRDEHCLTWDELYPLLHFSEYQTLERQYEFPDEARSVP